MALPIQLSDGAAYTSALKSESLTTTPTYNFFTVEKLRFCREVMSPGHHQSFEDLLNMILFLRFVENNFKNSFTTSQLHNFAA